MNTYQVDDVITALEMLLAEIDPERRDLVAAEYNVDSILETLKEGKNGDQEEGTDAALEASIEAAAMDERSVDTPDVE